MPAGAHQLADAPEQIVVFPVMEQTGLGFTVNVWLQEEVQPFAFVMVTV